MKLRPCSWVSTGSARQAEATEKEFCVMAINLRELRQACEAYLNNKVTVTVTQPTPGNGTQINANEPFTFRVTAVNANSANDGVQLTNVRYRIEVNPTVPATPNSATVRVPRLGRTTDLAGNPLAAGAFVAAMIHQPLLDAAAVLEVGESDTVGFDGRTGTENGGLFTIRARIIADIDEEFLFPDDQDSTSASISQAVQPV
jgi:hypothetical protein